MKRLNKEDPNYPALKLKREAMLLEFKAAGIEAKARKLIEEMESICIHNKTEKKYDYIPGSYYDRCVYINQIVCNDCGKVLAEERTTGGYG